MLGVVTGLVTGTGEFTGFAEGTVTGATGVTGVDSGLVAGTVTIVGVGMVSGETVTGVVGRVVSVSC